MKIFERSDNDELIENGTIRWDGKKVEFDIPNKERAKFYKSCLPVKIEDGYEFIRFFLAEFLHSYTVIIVREEEDSEWLDKELV